MPGELSKMARRDETLVGLGSLVTDYAGGYMIAPAAPRPAVPMFVLSKTEKKRVLIPNRRRLRQPEYWYRETVLEVWPADGMFRARAALVDDEQSYEQLDTMQKPVRFGAQDALVTMRLLVTTFLTCPSGYRLHDLRANFVVEMKVDGMSINLIDSSDVINAIVENTLEVLNINANTSTKDIKGTVITNALDLLTEEIANVTPPTFAIATDVPSHPSRNATS